MSESVFDFPWCCQSGLPGAVSLQMMPSSGGVMVLPFFCVPLELGLIVFCTLIVGGSNVRLHQ